MKLVLIIAALLTMTHETKMDYAYFGGGCFWCIEAIFESLNGVQEVISGYSGGDEKTANYENVSSGKTRHAEICRIKYNPSIISFDILLEVFFLAHDPTTLNSQGNDIGPQYRSIIFYQNKKEKEKAENYINELELKEVYVNIKTTLTLFEQFYEAENYHQNYFNSNPTQPYCSFVINPKVQKLRKKLNKYYN
jgi:peptide-methionine (S)-S-oxide reductase